MQRLSLAELKAAQSNNVVANLEAIKGGNLAGCHTPTPPANTTMPSDGTKTPNAKQ